MSDRTSKPVAFKRTTLAAAIALTFATPAAFAAPSANQLPGNGVVTSGSVTSSNQSVPSSGPETITLGKNTVITWGGSGTPKINTGQPSGFNIGSQASLTFKGSHAVLNIDASGNPSQIMGSLTNNGDLFVANGNGIIVSGSNASIKSTSGMVGLIGESGSSLHYGSTLSGNTYDGISFNGTKGGNVTIGKSAKVGGTGTTQVLVAGGGNVNVGDLGNLSGTSSVTVMAGQPSSNGGSFASNNKNAVLTVSGTAPANTSLDTAGTLVTTNTASENYTDFATNHKSLTLNLGTANHYGKLDNKGTLYVQKGLNYGTSRFDTLNNSVIDWASPSVITLPGSLTNKGHINIDESGGGGLPVQAKNSNVQIQGGDLTNKGTINGSYKPSASSPLQTFSDSTTSFTTAPLQIDVLNGSINNSGTIKHVNGLSTYSNSKDTASFTSGADYSVTNSGTISTGSNDYVIKLDANAYGRTTGSADNTTGSVTNTGFLQFGNIHSGQTGQYTSTLKVYAHNNVTMGGHVEQIAPGAIKPSAVSASNPLGFVDLADAKGTVSLSTPLVTVNNSFLYGQQINLMANLSNVTSASDSAPSGKITINAGADQNSRHKYAVRVAKGKTVSAGTVNVWGQRPSGSTYANPNVILQGTLSGNTIQLGGTGTGSVSSNPTTHGAVSDVFSGPKGGLTTTGKNPTVKINFTGRVKDVPYNDHKHKTNFQHHYLPIKSTNPVNLDLNPVAYQTNGTTGVSSSGGSLSGVNILVNKSVTVQDNLNGGSKPSAVPSAGESSGTGTNHWPNTHLVLQSTGNITTTGNNGNFYWPGLVYLGTINTVNGQPNPDALSNSGQIITDGNFNNVLPGSRAKGGGIHFETAPTLSLGGNVVTNANSWVNFSTKKLAKYYASMNANKHVFYGGSFGKGTGKVVNYKLLPSSDFHAQPLTSKLSLNGNQIHIHKGPFF